MTRPLRGYQADAIDRLRASLRSGKRRPVLHLPTGGGKTRIAAEIIGLARKKGHRSLFVAPALSLIDQTVMAFWKDGVRDVGVIQADHPMTDWSQPVQVASVQSLVRRAKPDVGLVIVDECHVMHKAFLEWIAEESMRNIPVIGLSATPWAKGMGRYYDDLIICATTQQMVDDGYLSKFRVFAPAHPDLSGVSTVAGEFHKGQLETAMNKGALVADIVETWLRMGEGRPTLAFGVDRAHAKHIQAKFEEAGIPCGYIDAFTDSADRNQIRDKFHRGEYKVVSNVCCLTTGTDWDVRCIIDARPTKSEMLFVQIYGRGLRTAVGKDDLIILDHADNYTRHGFVTDIHHEKLDNGRPNDAAKKRKPPLPKECPQCHYLRPAKVAVCPCCGFKPEAVPSIETEDGTLTEVRRGTGSKSGGPKNHVQIGGRWIPNWEFYGMLKERSRIRGYKPGWAAQKYRDAVGTWPNAYRDVAERPVCWEVDSWLKSQAIRWAKRQEKQAKERVQGVANAA